MLGCFIASPIVFDEIPTSYRHLVPKVVKDSSDYLVNDYELEDFDTSVDSLDIHSWDFSLANIVKSGSTSMLKPIVMSSSSNFTFVDSFENLHVVSDSTLDK